MNNSNYHASMVRDFGEPVERDGQKYYAPEGSQNWELLQLPQQRPYNHTWDMKGRLLLLPRTGIIGVPFEEHRGGWTFVVVNGEACKKDDGTVSYPRGGYNIEVSDLEMTTAIELEYKTQ